MPDYYDRQGNRMGDMLEWAALFEREDAAYERHVAQEVVKGRWGSLWISTVWLGIDHNFGRGGRPLIFETMAFRIRPKTWNDVIGEINYAGFAQVRSSTEEEALEVHRHFAQSLG